MKNEPTEFEVGYLTDQKLSAEEIASIAATLERSRRRPRYWLRLTAVAATFGLIALLVNWWPVSVPLPSNETRTMVLEIQRTDTANAKPYKLMIQMEGDSKSAANEVSR